MFRRVVTISACLLVTAIGAEAQQAQQPPPPTTTAPAATTTGSEDTRPATTTFLGDTGLWFVPTGEVLPKGRWSAGGYYTNFDYTQGFTDVSHYIGTFGYGLGRVELFGSWRFVTLVDRDTNADGEPLFNADPRFGGVVNEHPLMRTSWSGGQLGDLLVGAKFNVLSESRQQPVAFAVRGVVKLPTGSDEDGAGTGKADFLVDAIVSKEVNRAVELTGFGGFIIRGDPSGVELSDGFRWGVGLGGPTRRSLRAFAELHGEIASDDQVTLTRSLVGTDGSIAPLVSDLENKTRFTAGVTWQGRNGLFLGTAANWDLPVDSRDDFGYNDGGLDKFSMQFRIGYHPGVAVYAPPPPPPAPAPPAPPQNRPPTVKARCNPCTVEVGKSSTLTADGQDPDGDTLTYKWTVPTGSFANPAERETLWTAPNQEGTVPVTVTVDDGKAGTATDTVNIQVIRPAVKEYVFEDVHFDFDRYTLREEATRILGEAVTALRANPGLRIEIEGHTCNIGTAEYNLALGERRANAVRDYLTSNGITADRLRSVSYGEERPKHDNAREETRRLNRRAALTVRIQQQ
jgi:outer membrane protein OmpA-like peptidoglycan-associated protein